MFDIDSMTRFDRLRHSAIFKYLWIQVRVVKAQLRAMEREIISEILADSNSIVQDSVVRSRHE